MAFYGLQWVSPGVNKIKPSEIDELGLIKLQKTIRESGILLAETKYKNILNDIAYCENIFDQETSWNDYMIDIFKNISITEKDLIVQLVSESLNGSYENDPRFHALTDNQKYLVAQYQQYIDYQKELEKQKKRFTRLTGTFELIQINKDLWEYEYELASQRAIEKENQNQQEAIQQKETIKKLIEKISASKLYNEASETIQGMSPHVADDQDAEFVLQNLKDITPDSKFLAGVNTNDKDERKKRLSKGGIDFIFQGN